jgi:hypothetical protein
MPPDYYFTNGSAKLTIRQVMMFIMRIRTAGAHIIFCIALNHIHAYLFICQLKDKTDKASQTFFFEQLFCPENQFIQRKNFF